MGDFKNAQADEPQAKSSDGEAPRRDRALTSLRSVWASYWEVPDESMARFSLSTRADIP